MLKSTCMYNVCLTTPVFSARQHIAYSISTLNDITCRSVCHMGWITQKWLKMGQWNFHHAVAPSI